MKIENATFDDPSLEPICRNCRFWGKDAEMLTLPKDVKDCGNLSVALMLQKTEAEYPFLTTPNFGCIHFEAKDE